MYGYADPIHHPTVDQCILGGRSGVACCAEVNVLEAPFLLLVRLSRKPGQPLCFVLLGGGGLHVQLRAQDCAGHRQ